MNAVTFVIGGYDTTRSAIINYFYALLNNTDEMHKLQQEIDEHIHQDVNLLAFLFTLARFCN
jgi:cytochrome P450